MTGKDQGRRSVGDSNVARLAAPRYAGATMIDAARLPDLPVTAVLPALAQALENGRNAVLVAPPGAGKTTLVPL
ncbi:MAG: hypothetical protein JNL61_16285, partial [Rhizobiaceae bacterium]|nr:hypothetical protein [Rhizobiaceae bacterium]